MSQYLVRPDFNQKSEQETKIPASPDSSPMPQPLADWLSRVLGRARSGETESQQSTGDQNE